MNFKATLPASLACVALAWPDPSLAEQFTVGGKHFDNETEAQAYADGNRNAWVATFTPDVLAQAGIVRRGGSAIFLMPSDDYIKSVYMLRPSSRRISERKISNKDRNGKIVRYIRDGIDLLPLTLSRASYFDSIVVLPYDSTRSIFSYNTYNADYAIYIDALYDSEGDLGMTGASAFAHRKDKIVYTNFRVANLKSGQSDIFFRTVGNPNIYETVAPLDVFRLLDRSIGLVK